MKSIRDETIEWKFVKNGVLGFDWKMDGEQSETKENLGQMHIRIYHLLMKSSSNCYIKQWYTDEGAMAGWGRSGCEKRFVITFYYYCY